MILNTSANSGMEPEARVEIRYKESTRVAAGWKQGRSAQSDLRGYVA